MVGDEFRTRAYEAVDAIADYWQRLMLDARALDAQALEAPTVGVPALPIRSGVRPGEFMAALPAHAPEHPEPWAGIFGDLQREIIPALTHWQAPGFFGYFPANTSGPAVIGDLLAAGLGVQGMLWATSPACTELETRVLDWMADAIGLPASFRSDAREPSRDGSRDRATGGGGGGVIQGTASEAALVAMCAARHAAREADRSLDQPTDRAATSNRLRPLIAYTSQQAHSSILKAAMIAGVCEDQRSEPDAFGATVGSGLRTIRTDAQFRMDPDALAGAIEEDLRLGRRPFFVCATIGTTGTMAIDPLRRIGELCARHAIWLHVDAAFAGSALICPEHRAMIDGVELADTFCFNPHKWLLTNFDCSLLWTRRREQLVGALSVTPEYLRTSASDSGVVIDYRDWQVPLGRRFRALKLWLVLRHFGLSGLRAYIREHVRLGEVLEALVRDEPRVMLAAPRGLSLVCLRVRPLPGESLASANARTRRLIDRLNASGLVFVSHTVVPASDAGATPGATGLPSASSASEDSALVLRVAIGGTFTSEAHVRGTWSLIRRTLDELDRTP